MRGVARLGAALVEQGATLAVAESVSGGRVAAALTALAGSSAWFRGGVVPYVADLKVDLLGVDPGAAGRDQAVSRRVAEEMAEGVRQRLQATWGAATTGLAGPGGGTASNPVGTVWVAVAGEAGTISEHFIFAGSRESVQRAARDATLRAIITAVLGTNKSSLSTNRTT